MQLSLHSLQNATWSLMPAVPGYQDLEFITWIPTAWRSAAIKVGGLRWHLPGTSELSGDRYRFGIWDMFSRKGLGKFGDNLSANHWKYCNLRSLAMCIDWATAWSWAAVHMTPGRQQWDAAFSLIWGPLDLFCFWARHSLRLVPALWGWVDSFGWVDWCGLAKRQQPLCDFNLFDCVSLTLNLFRLKNQPLLCTHECCCEDGWSQRDVTCCFWSPAIGSRVRDIWSCWFILKPGDSIFGFVGGPKRALIGVWVHGVLYTWLPNSSRTHNFRANFSLKLDQHSDPNVCGWFKIH